MLTKALNKTATDDDWSALGAVGNHLNRTDPSFDPRTYGFAKLSDLVKGQPFLEAKTVQAESGQGQLWVRLKRRGEREEVGPDCRQEGDRKAPAEEPDLEPPAASRRDACRARQEGGCAPQDHAEGRSGLRRGRVVGVSDVGVVAA